MDLISLPSPPHLPLLFFKAPRKKIHSEAATLQDFWLLEAAGGLCCPQKFPRRSTGRDQSEIISPALEHIPLSQKHIPGAKEKSHLCGKGAARRGDVCRGGDIGR